MRSLFNVIILVIMLSSCQSQRDEPTQFPLADVYASGALREVMQNGNLQANILIDSLETSGLIGLGPKGRLDGEITILDGQRFITSIDSLGNPTSIKVDSLQAPFFAYANVSSWQSFGYLKEVKDLPSLQVAIEELATIEDLDLTKPFPFQIKGIINSAMYHVINKSADEIEHSHDLHKQAKVSLELGAEEVIFVGFYSQEHQGIFTHMGDFIHIHILFKESGITGHLDKINADANKLELWVGLK